MKNQKISALLWANKKCCTTSRIYESALKVGVNLCVVESLQELLKVAVTGEFQILILDANNVMCDQQILQIFKTEQYFIPFTLIICDKEKMFEADVAAGLYVSYCDNACYALMKILNNITLNNMFNDNNQSSNYRSDIRKYFLNMGLSTKYLGFEYLIEITQVILNSSIMTKSLNSNVYPVVASKFYTTPTAVERNIRHILTSCWSTSNKLQAAFSGYYENDKAPSNRLFICSITNFLKQELNIG